MSCEQQSHADDGPALSEAHAEWARDHDAMLGRSLALVRFLRTRCPWDARQTPTSLRPYLLEEAAEVGDSILSGDDAALRPELGDLLLNVAFQIVLAEERGAFGACEVARSLEEKMRRRHPHVYGDAEAAPDWEGLKAAERAGAKETTDAEGTVDPFAGMARGLEPLSRALRLQDRAAAYGFDWAAVSGALAKLREEIGELEAALAATCGSAEVSGAAGSTEAGNAAHFADTNATGQTAAQIVAEAGDLIFAAVNVLRLAGVHPAVALDGASQKFARRFRHLLRLAARSGVCVEEATLEDLDKLWESVKRSE